MYKHLLPFLFLTAVVLVIFNCGQISGDNPIGVTGGGEDGYQGQNEASFPNGLDARLFGRWTPPPHWEEIRYLTFYSNGEANFSIYNLGELEESTAGTWSADGYYFTIDIDGFNPESGWYSVGADELYLYTPEQYYYYIRAID